VSSVPLNYLLDELCISLKYKINFGQYFMPVKCSSCSPQNWACMDSRPVYIFLFGGGAIMEVQGH
jgi:hypothetical protein